MLDRDVIEHESAHAAAAVILGLDVSRIDAVGGEAFQGQLRYFKSIARDQRREELMVLLAGGDVPSGFPPNAVTSNGHDLAHVHKIVRETRMTASEYYALKARTQTLMETDEFRTLQQRFESALVGNGGVLNEEAVDSVIRRWKWDNDGG